MPRLGELAEQYLYPPLLDPRLAFVKWGLAGCGVRSQESAISNQQSLLTHACCLLTPDSWQARLASELRRPTNPQTVIVAYADWQCAQAPPITEVVDFACQRPGNVLLIDTHCKEPDTLKKDRRPTLLDWITVHEVRALCAQCHGAGVRVALAGSLGFAQMEHLRCAEPDWFAVRGAVCAGADRLGTVDKVRTGYLAKPDWSRGMSSPTDLPGEY